MAVVGALCVVAGTASQGSAGTVLSEGCNALNDPDLDGQYQGANTVGQFLAGEEITVSAGEPVEGPAPFTRLLINAVDGVSGGFPATLSYTVPADGSYSVEWFVIFATTGNATWMVSCTPAPPPTTTTTLPATTTTAPATTTTAPETTTTLPATTTTAVLPSTSMSATTTTAAATTTTAADTTTTAGQTTTTAGDPTTTVMPPGNTGTLPKTGPSGSSNIAGAAFLALLAGALALVVARRRAV